MANRSKSNKYQALKILTIDATQRHNAGQSRELKFLQEIEGRRNDADFDFLPLLRDHFVEQGPRGKHLCLVQDLYSISVSSLRRSSPNKTLHPYMARNIISMVVHALAKLHAMRIVHTGLLDSRLTNLYSYSDDIDVKPDNLLICNSSYYLDDDMQRYLEADPTEFEGEEQIDEETYPIFKSQPIPNRFTWDTSAFEAETMLIYLTDLGNGSRLSHIYFIHYSRSSQPRELANSLLLTVSVNLLYARQRQSSNRTLGQVWISGPWDAW